MEFTRRREFIAGFKDTFPLVLGAIPFAIIFGALAIDAGLSPAAAMGLSLFVFAGSAQFIGVGLVSQNASLAIIVLTTFVVNLRHALYSASLAPYVKHLPQTWLAPLAFWLTDETYAVVIRHYQRDDESPYKHWYYLGSAVFMYVNWNIFSVVGILAGQQLQGLNDLRLDFAMVVTFVGIVVPIIINRPMLVCAIVAGATGVLTYDMPNKMGLMVAAVLGIAAGILAETYQNRRTPTVSALNQEVK
ncbi:MAG: branched-chain amino acid ABC transporter permease [Anaerolineaceae bacterium]|nr:branched-chain amino acid ABC transporter permease [Anaerolineaceae bacterium]